jgi:hypothetical protein
MVRRVGRLQTLHLKAERSRIKIARIFVVLVCAKWDGALKDLEFLS